MAYMSPFPSESAWAASAGEARYRIDGTIVSARNARVIALDERAASVARRVADGPWAQAGFFTCENSGPAGDGDEIALRGLDGVPSTLAGLLATDPDVVVVLATDDTGRAQAAAIGRACGARAIMTAGVVLGDGFEADDAVAALRPYARVLLLSADESDVFELLTALRV
ncbi:MAG: 3-methyl-2-oxobutanoate hydroxymethyltransferase [Streptosporangiales bacterium]|nr:3-methyl-2-oxobutanoate hydroxymethyltransferase [Streptosporangiales bacterium]